MIPETMRSIHFSPVPPLSVSSALNPNDTIPEPVKGDDIVIGLSDRDAIGNLVYDKHIRLSIGEKTTIISAESAQRIGEAIIELSKRAIRP